MSRSNSRSRAAVLLFRALPEESDLSCFKGRSGARPRVTTFPKWALRSVRRLGLLHKRGKARRARSGERSEREQLSSMLRLLFAPSLLYQAAAFFPSMISHPAACSSVLLIVRFFSLGCMRWISATPNVPGEEVIERQTRKKTARRRFPGRQSATPFE